MNESRSEGATQLGTASSVYALLLALLVLSILLMVTTLVLIEGAGGTQNSHQQLAIEQQLLARNLLTHAIETSRGEMTGVANLQQTRDRLDQVLLWQKEGDAAQGLSPAPSAVTTQLVGAEDQWRQLRAQTDIILASAPALQVLAQLRQSLNRTLPDLVAASNEVVNFLIRRNAPATQIQETTLQLSRLQGLDAQVLRLLNFNMDTSAALRSFQQELTEFNNALRRLTEQAPQSGLDRVATLFNAIRGDAIRVVQEAPRIAQAQEATRALANRVDEFFIESEALSQAYANQIPGGVAVFGVTVTTKLAYIFGFLALAMLVMFVLLQRRDSRTRLDDSERRKHETEEQNRRNQEAILRLLDELGDLAEGDLTVQASVTEDITGAIADSVNYAIEALRDLVSTINRTAEQMASAAQETRSVADRLARASEVQARQIESSSKTVMQMAKFMDEVAEKTASSAEVAERSVGIAHEGGDRVRRTIQGMDAIREHIQETSKRIKRLGESSQEIGDIVALINDIADQTNILALNAAIQASAAGEAGRGFAVVADEVQRLAERSSNATKRIEALVKTIQADTNEAVISMEKSTTEVVAGAGLAEKAGEALEEIEQVSARLAELINEISTASAQVTEMAAKVSSAMASINEITGQTAESSVATASSIGTLNQLAQELQQSVAGFRLPDQSLSEEMEPLV